MAPINLRKTLTKYLPKNIYLENYNLKSQNHLLRNLGIEKMTDKPVVDLFSSDAPAIQPKRRQIPYLWFYDINETSTIIRTCTMNIRNEIFRRGGAWKPRFQKKCVDCGQEYSYEPEDDICEKEGCRGILRYPDPEQYKEADDFFFGMKDGAGKTNYSLQNLWDVLKEFEDDLNITDDAYLILIREYTYLASKMEGSRIVEVIRAHPHLMHIVSDNKGTYGHKWMICPEHRASPFEYAEGQRIKNCPVCGKELQDVLYMNSLDGRAAMSYFIAGEVIHKSKYKPSAKYGTSPILTLWKLANSLIQMEEWVYSAYSKRRIPGGLLAVNTKNPDSFYAWWDKELLKVQQDRDRIPIMAVDSNTSGNAVDFVKFMEGNKEMEYIPVQDKIRERCSALYGVSNIFMGDTSTSGGLNNEGMQIVVTNRAVANGQAVYNQSVFPALCEVFQITDWKYELLPSEEEDEMAMLQRDGQRIMNAQAMKNLGYDIDLKPTETGEVLFEFSGEANTSEPMPEPKQPGGGDEANQQSGGHALNRMSKAEEEGMNLEKTFWEQAVDAIKQGALYPDTYEGLNKKQSKEVNRMIYSMFKEPEWDYATLTKDLIEKFRMPEEQADTIVRTESLAVANKSRELAYVERMKDSGEEYVFRWQGPSDDRTTQTCKEIAKVISNEGGAVSLKRLKQVVHDVSRKYNPDLDYREFVPHINCRHRILRVVS